MPAPLALEFRVQPSMERSHEQGLVLRLETDDDVSGPDARVWLVRGDWLEQPETTELRQRQSSTFPRARAADIFKMIKSASVLAAPEPAMGFHATTYRLLVQLGFNSVSYVWWHELPAAWQALASVLSELAKLATAAADGSEA
jgi:hypothetical protein